MARSIEIRDVPDDVYAELRREATEAGLSLSTFVRAELVRLAARSRNVRTLTRLASRDDVSLQGGEVVELIEDGRAERRRT